MYGLDLKELAALLEMARVFVGNDSGPMHVAAALGRPVVAVWGSSQPTVWHPWSDAPWLIVRQETSQESEIKRVAASQVIAAVDEVLELAMEANYKVGIADQAQRVR
jgi:ADP-heptose:LPS heptosyltransferase